MDTPEIFRLQFLLSLVVWTVIARSLVGPWLNGMARDRALLWLTLPHAFRHIGMVFLVPGVVAQPLPADFSVPAAYGDLLAGVLALVALIALRARWAGAVALVWLFNLVGTVDLLNALRHRGVAADFGAAWFIPTFLVPLLLVTHFMIFVRLLRRERGATRVDAA